MEGCRSSAFAAGEEFSPGRRSVVTIVALRRRGAGPESAGGALRATLIITAGAQSGAWGFVAPAPPRRRSARRRAPGQPAAARQAHRVRAVWQGRKPDRGPAGMGAAHRLAAQFDAKTRPARTGDPY